MDIYEAIQVLEELLETKQPEAAAQEREALDVVKAAAVLAELIISG